MSSNYERNESVPPAKIGHLAARVKLPSSGDARGAGASVPSKSEIEVSYDELIITSSIELPDLDEAAG